MAEQAGLERPLDTLDKETLGNNRDRMLLAVSKYAMARSHAIAIQDQSLALKAQENELRQNVNDDFVQYKLDIIAAVESGAVSGREAVVLFADCYSIHDAIMHNEDITDIADRTLQQYDAMQPGELVALPVYKYGADEYFDYHLLELTSTPLPVINQQSSHANQRLQLSYEFVLDDNGTVTRREVGQIIVGKDKIIATLETAAAAYINACEGYSNNKSDYTVDRIMNSRNSMIILAETLGLQELAEKLIKAKTKAAILILENEDEDYSQDKYTEAARHLFTMSTNDYYQVLGNTIIDTEEILRRVKATEYKLFAALHYAHLPEEETRHSFSEKQCLRAAAWFVTQHDLLQEAEAKKREEGEEAWLASQQDSLETPE
jgi:hypothetical protein